MPDTPLGGLCTRGPEECEKCPSLSCSVRGGVRSLVIDGDKGGVGERMTLRHREAAKA